MPLFYHSGALGDFLLSLPFLRALRRTRGQEDWTFAVHEEHAALVRRLFPHVRRLSPWALDLAPLMAGTLEAPVVAELLKRFGGVFGFLQRGSEIERIAIEACPGCPVVIAEPFSGAVSRGRLIEDVLADVLARL